MLIYKNIVNYIKQWPPIMLYLLNTRGVTSNQQKFYVTGMSYFYVFITTCYLGRVYLKCMFIHILHIQVCLSTYENTCMCKTNPVCSRCVSNLKNI